MIKNVDAKKNYNLLLARKFLKEVRWPTTITPSIRPISCKFALNPAKPLHTQRFTIAAAAFSLVSHLSSTHPTPTTTTSPLHNQIYRKLNLDFTQTPPKQNQLKMSSAYQAPTTGATAIATHNTNYDASTDGPAINYLCGDCNSKVSLKRAEPIRCKECGHRVLYKERTKRYAIF